MAAKYKSGSFAVPGSTGNFSVTGLGFEPDGVYFFGSNFVGLDTVVTLDGNHGMFGGIMARDYASSTLLAESSNITIDKHGFLDQRPIRQDLVGLAPFRGYLAEKVSLDADGFTVNFTFVNAAAGTRYIHWLAWGEADNAGAIRTWSGAGDVTLTLGYMVKSLLTVGGFDNTSDGVQGFDPTTGAYGWYGGGSYQSAGPAFAGVFMVDALRGQQRVGMNHTTGSTPTITENYRPGIVAGTLLGGQNRTRPSGGGLTDLFIDYVSSIRSFDIQAFWDSESSAGSVTPVDSAGSTVTETMSNSLVDELAAVIFWTTGDTDAFGTTLSANMGFGVATPDHQACVFMDGSALRGFQSITKGWCCDVSAGGGVAGTTALEDQQFTLTTTNDGGPAGRQMMYMAFGPFIGGEEFIPQFFRVLPS
jgi:hypothetical protein